MDKPDICPFFAAIADPIKISKVNPKKYKKNLL